MNTWDILDEIVITELILKHILFLSRNNTNAYTCKKKKRISWRNPHKMIKFHHDLVFQILVEREIKVEKNILTFLTKSKFKKAKKKIIFTKKNSKNPVVHNRSKVQTNFGGGGGQKRIMY